MPIGTGSAIETSRTQCGCGVRMWMWLVGEVVYADDNTTTFRLNVRAGFVYKNNRRHLSNYTYPEWCLATSEIREDFPQNILLLVEYQRAPTRTHLNIILHGYRCIV